MFGLELGLKLPYKFIYEVILMLNAFLLEIFTTPKSDILSDTTHLKYGHIVFCSKLCQVLSNFYKTLYAFRRL